MFVHFRVKINVSVNWHAFMWTQRLSLNKFKLITSLLLHRDSWVTHPFQDSCLRNEVNIIAFVCWCSWKSKQGELNHLKFAKMLKLWHSRWRFPLKCVQCPPPVYSKWGVIGFQGRKCPKFDFRFKLLGNENNEYDVCRWKCQYGLCYFFDFL